MKGPKKRKRKRAPSVFVSYSSADKHYKKQVISHLGVLLKQGHLSIWDDTQIAAGVKWQPAIEGAIQSARIALLLISADFLNSRFILGKEIPKLLKQRKKSGLLLFPIIIRSCDWKSVGWLSKLQVRPEGGRALRDLHGDARDRALTAIAKEVRLLLRSTR